MGDHTKIAVLEGQWFPKSNLSMRSIFDLVCRADADNIDAYHYEMAFSPEALAEAIPRLKGTKHIHHLFVGQHGNVKGDAKHLIMPNNENVELEILAKLMRKGDARYKLRGLHLSSCGLMSQEAAELLLDDTRLDWVSGYSKDCDWLNSSLLDALFAAYIYDESGASSPKAQIEAVAAKLMELAEGLIEDTGLAIYRKSDRSVVNLVAQH